ncbi:helix-turn-helix domain-containing protein [Vibrio splendidus]
MNNYNTYLCNDEFNTFKNKLVSQLLEVNPDIGLFQSKRKLNLFVKIVDYSIENISMEICLDEVAKEVDASKFEICRLFNENFQTSPMRWLWDVRIQFAREYINVAPHWSLTDISNACGFNSLAHFSRCFRKAHNTTALKYKASVSQTPRDEKPYDIIYGDKRNSFSRNVVLSCFK